MVLTKLYLGFLKIEVFNEFYSFLLTWDPMGVKISEHYPSYKSQLKVFKLLLIFPPNGPHRTALLWIFNDFFIENIKFTIVHVIAYEEIKNLNYLKIEGS